MKSRAFAPVFVLAATLAGCSSEGDILPKKGSLRPTPDTADASADVEKDVAADTSPDVKKPRDPNANCVKPGTPKNEAGIGGYCEPMGTDCESPLGARFCTADFRDIAPVDDDKWFCSMICMTDAECGTGALCAENGPLRGCAPIACIGKDAGK